LKLKITVDGKLYEVNVEIFEPEQPQPGYYLPPGQTRVPAAAPVAPPAARSSGGSAPVVAEGKVCRSPFSGTVSKISAQAGQTILVNDVLLILEAMKMETVITAPIAGKVAKINVNVGDAVQQGQVLVEFD
jgi:methylmalonyl-CoA carboxyltransferase small subunit